MLVDMVRNRNRFVNCSLDNREGQHPRGIGTAGDARGAPKTPARFVLRTELEPHSIIRHMETERTRQSDRIQLALPIQVSGTDISGREFIDETQAIVIGRNGAKIRLARGLAPLQELVIRCPGTGLEASVRVVGQIGTSPEGHYYGVEILNPEVNLWGIGFPPKSESEAAVGRVLLECMSCHARELTYLNELQFEVFQARQSVSLPCKHCRDTTIWTESLHERASQPTRKSRNLSILISQPPPAPPLRTQNERKQPRLDMKVRACIKTHWWGEDVVTTEDVSRGGFRYRSTINYSPGSTVEVAVPYSQGAGNIFVQARIAWVQELPGKSEKLYGVCYSQAPKGQVEK